ncbi:MAG: Phospholipase C [Piccolia ochrophora]|nr:MAG: Phospholipase C [Piccolia ochrophora]
MATASPLSASAMSARLQARSSPLQTSSFERRSNHQISALDTLAMAPASAMSYSSGSSSPVPASPQLGQETTNTSVQPSPDLLWGRDAPTSSPTPLQLPDAGMVTPPSLNAMSEAIAMSKGTGLMRRLSRGAANKLSRRRTSSTNVNRRDQSSGPVMMRRRSDSQGGVDNTRDNLAFDTDENEDGDDSVEMASLAGLDGTKDGCRTPGSVSTAASVNIAGVGPVIPSLLQRGTTIIKVTKKKRKPVKFFLDIDAAKVYWDPTKLSKRFYIDDIREIRTGVDARNYREEFQVPREMEDRWFTILFADDGKAKGRRVKTLHLIAPNDYVFDLWTSTLEDIKGYRIDMMASWAGQSDRSIKAHWNREMTRISANRSQSEDDGRLNLEDVESLCHKLHINCSKKYLRSQFAVSDPDNTGSLDFAGFKDFVRRLKERRDVRDVFKTIASDEQAGLTKSEFLKFLQSTQHIETDSDPVLWEGVFQKYAKKPKAKTCEMTATEQTQPARIKLEAFTAFLFSSHIAVAQGNTAAEPLERPLNEYFVSSSHNTYLLGRQVAGESSTEAYIRALQRGCRCVEVDCWDGADGRPVVNHGRTLTSKVLFSDCISVIGKYAFVSTPYPLIISLEVHCGPEQQAVMADILRSNLGDRLLSQPFITNSLTLPSPEELKHRILIKVKGSEEMDECAMVQDMMVGRRQRSLSSPLSRPVLTDDSVIPTIPPITSPTPMSPIKRSPSTVHSVSSRRQITGGTGTSTSSATEESDSRDGTMNSDRNRKKKKASKIVKPLGDLGVYTRGQKYADFVSAESRSYNHVFSFSERTFENLCKDTELKLQMEKHNMRYLMRVYPAGYRINSSNFDPNKFWRRGVQMVALNWQTYDLSIQMNDAMFAAGTDRTGYVLKPKELRQAKHSMNPPLDAFTAQTRKEKKLVKFSVDVVSAQQLPRSRGMSPDQSIDPYIEVEVYCADDKAKGGAIGEGGLDASARNGKFGMGSPHRRRTRIVPSNGYNPVFNDKFVITLETKFPSLVFVRWTVWNSADGRTYGDRNGALATYTAKLSSLQQGYRHLPLYDSKGEQFLFSTLFCRIKKEKIVIVQRDDAKAGKVESIKQFGRSMFNRTMSAEKRISQEDLRRVYP